MEAGHIPPLHPQHISAQLCWWQSSALGPFVGNAKGREGSDQLLLCCLWWKSQSELQLLPVAMISVLSQGLFGMLGH